jgi:uncharacterized protein
VRRVTLTALSIVLLLTFLPALAQEKLALPVFIRANYTKHEFRIPMRDGVRLFTSVFVPKDAAPDHTYPVLFKRTPYGVAPYGVENYRNDLGPSEGVARSKFIFVYQDIRGRYMSEGEFVNVRPHRPDKTLKSDIDESSDAYDTIDWILKNIPHHNGRVGMWGVSYPGFYAACAMIDAHSALKAVSPQAPVMDWFIGDDFHHNGAFFLAHFFNFMATFGLPRAEPTTKFPSVGTFSHGTKDGYGFFMEAEPLSQINEKFLHRNVAYWNEIAEHPDYDSYWQRRVLSRHIKNIRPAVLVTGGWFDAEDIYGTLRTYAVTSQNNPAHQVTLVMGPWYHAGWALAPGDHLGDISFNLPTAAYYRDKIELPFFEHHLKTAPSPNLAAAYVFQTGRNEWRSYDAWPPASATKRALYFGAKGRLQFEAPTATDNAFDQYVSDPAKPVPFIDQPNTGMMKEYMIADQRLQGRRTDVLVYQTEPLEEDVTISGPLHPVLFVSTTGTDSDWVVKLIDVYPNDLTSPEKDKDPYDPDKPNPIQLSAYQQLVRGEPFRGRYRNSFERPQPFEPGKATKIEFDMPDVNHTFRAGHRIMIQIQSSWFPLVDINPQTFVNIYKAKPGDFRAATQRVYRTRRLQSRMEILVLSEPAATR